MDKHSVFSKTGKGLLEIKNRGNRLPKDQFRILNLVDGKTVFAELAVQSRVPEIELRKIVTALSDGGYIKELVSPAGEAGDLLEPSSEDDLDFTKCSRTRRPSNSRVPLPCLLHRRRGQQHRRRPNPCRRLRPLSPCPVCKRRLRKSSRNSAAASKRRTRAGKRKSSSARRSNPSPRPPRPIKKRVRISKQSWRRCAIRWRRVQRKG
jgi:hypothetical protein